MIEKNTIFILLSNLKFDVFVDDWMFRNNNYQICNRIIIQITNLHTSIVARLVIQTHVLLIIITVIYNKHSVFLIQQFYNIQVIVFILVYTVI